MLFEFQIYNLLYGDYYILPLNQKLVVKLIQNIVYFLKLA
jgi:hypothetical protein